MSYISTLTASGATTTTAAKVSPHHHQHHHHHLIKSHHNQLQQQQIRTSSLYAVGQQRRQQQQQQQNESTKHVDKLESANRSGPAAKGGGGIAVAERELTVTVKSPGQQRASVDYVTQKLGKPAVATSIPTTNISNRIVNSSSDAKAMPATPATAANALQAGRLNTTTPANTSGIPAPSPRIASQYMLSDISLRQNQSQQTTGSPTISGLIDRPQNQQSLTPKHIQAAPRLSKASPRLNQQQCIATSQLNACDKNKPVSANSSPGSHRLYAGQDYVQQQQQQQQKSGINMGQTTVKSHSQLGRNFDYIDRCPQFTYAGDFPADSKRDPDRFIGGSGSNGGSTRTRLSQYQRQHHPVQVTKQSQQQVQDYATKSNQQNVTYPKALSPRTTLTSVTSRIPHQVHGSEAQTTSDHGNSIERFYQCRKSVEGGGDRADSGDVGEDREEGDHNNASNNANNSNKSKYLTFSKDQATSHFKSLKEELSNGQLSPLNRLSNHNNNKRADESIDDINKEHESRSQPVIDINKPSEISTTTSNIIQPTSPTQPRPLDRVSLQKQKQLIGLVASGDVSSSTSGRIGNINQHDDDNSIDNNNKLHGDRNEFKKLPFAIHNNNNNNSSFRQQPICEAFIMTGQSMLKLSCNESENSTTSTATSSNKSNSNNNIPSSSTNNIMGSNISNNNSKRSNNNININNNSTDNIQHTHCSAFDQPQQQQQQHLANLHEQQQRGKSHSLSKLNASVCDSSTSSVDPTVPRGDPNRIANKAGPASTTTTQTGIDGHDKEEPLSKPQQQHQLQRQQPIGAQKHEPSSHDGGQSSLLSLSSEQLKRQQQNRQDSPHSTTKSQLKLLDNQQIEEPTFTIINEDDLIKKHQMLDQSQQQSLHQHQQENSNKQTIMPLDQDERPIATARDQRPSSPVKRSPEQVENTAMGQQQQQQQQHPPTKDLTCNDRDSARRLAKRLYNLSGFKKSDVCHHLAKNNPFSQMVAEEYLNLFDFRTMKLDAALRKFLSKLQLNGETQERERMLGQFSQRYYDCNKDKFPNSDTVQTLVCALILLNTDLHGNHHDKKKKNKRTKLSLGAFIDGLNSSLASLPTSLATTTTATSLATTQCGNGQTANFASQLSSVTSNTNSAVNPNGAYTFPRYLLVDLYESIKKRPIKYIEDKCDMTSFEAELDKLYNQHQQLNSRSNTLPTRRYSSPNSATSLSASSRRQLKYGLGNKQQNGLGNQMYEGNSIEFKSGFLSRKRTFEPQGKPTGKGRRGWRRAFVIINDLRLIMRYGQQKPDELDNVENQHNTTGDNAGDGAQDNGKKELASTKQDQPVKVMGTPPTSEDIKSMIKIHHAYAKRSTTYTKREFVFHLHLADQSEYLLQANSEQEMHSWIDAINFASACLSSPALASAVSNTKKYQLRQQRPILPASPTKLAYWDQLVDHEERLQRLKIELEDHLNEASNTRNANKRFKTEFIEKIAYLKHDIERYSVYLELMRRKSNSPEAIVLSKHPQIASLTPSDEMIKSLPSFAPLTPRLATSVDGNK